MFYLWFANQAQLVEGIHSRLTQEMLFISWDAISDFNLTLYFYTF